MKVVFVGGAQALRLAEAFVRDDDGLRETSWMPDFSLASPDEAAEFREADRVVWIDEGGVAPDADALALRDEPIHLPPLRLEFLWPFGGQPHIANAPDDLHPEGPFPAELGDAWLNRALEGHSRPEAAAQAYLALDVAQRLDLERMKAMTLAQQSARDKILGADFASRIEEAFRRRPLFLSPGVPGAELFDVFARLVFARLGVAYAGEGATAPQGRELPAHPSLAAHFGLAYAGGPAAGWGEPVDFAEYVHRYLAYAEGPQGERGLALMAQRRFAEAAEALKVAAVRPMGRRSQGLRQAFARARLLAEGVEAHDVEAAVARDDAHYSHTLADIAGGRWRDAERAWLAWLQGAEAGPQDYEKLADIREKLGDAEGAFAALELAAGLAPQDARLAARMTQAHAARGDVIAAARSAEREIALAPPHPQAQAALAAIWARAGRPGLSD